MDWEEIIKFSLITIWSIIILYNIIYFLLKESREIDKIFIPKKNFETAIEDLELLKKYKSKPYSNAHKKILFYQKNSKLTRRKYSYYRDKIDSGIIKLYFGGKKTRKENFSLLDPPLKIFLLFIYTFFIILILGIIAFFVSSAKPSPWIFVFSIAILAILVRFYNYLFRINYLILYCIVEVAFYFTKRDRGRFHRNYAVLDLLTSSWWGTGNYGGTLITAGGVSSYGGGSSSDFGGFGGGDFGGGGAGGSW